MMNENYNTPNSSCCGRPFVYSTKPKCGHNDCCMNEYKYTMPACIRNKNPDCTAQAVIPSITVETTDGISNLANCFVHVTSNNTTYYVDDKHRVMTTWSGLVPVEDYDFDANPFNLRNQIAYDEKNNVVAIYDDRGNYYIFQLATMPDDYVVLNNKPMINGVTLVGDLSLSSLGINSINNNEINNLLI